MKDLIVNLKRSSLGSRGVALLMVLSALVLLSGLIVEFAYNANVTYNLALNEKDKVQAYYLAQSGIAFSKLVLKFDKEARSLAEQASKQLGKPVQIQPLYEMIPISSELLRGLTMLEEGAPAGEGENKGEEIKKELQGEGAELKKEGPAVSGENLSVVDVKGAQEFLKFEGDFSAEVSEEDAKANLNAFYGLTPTQKEYERLKGILYHLLVNEEFKGFFEDRFRDAKELAQNIADYIDRDDMRNEGGEDRGREGVSQGKNYKMKNAKLISVEELIMVPGMTEEVFQALKPYVTIYGKDEKIFACRAKEPLVQAMILAYTENNTKMEPVKDDNVELIKKAMDAVLNSCPDSQAMASELDKVLGVTQPETAATSSTSTTTATGATSKGGSTTAKTVQFSDLIKKEATIYSIIGTGTVGESEVKIKTVLDTGSGSGSSWKQLYWRVE